jgi:methionyl-tRNA formyltransferase
VTPSPAGDATSAAPVRTIFFGSGPFAVPILDSLATNPLVTLVAVVSVPDRPAGRGRRLAAAPVVARARELGLPVQQPARLRDPAFVQALRILHPRVGVLADFGRLVPEPLLEIPDRGFLNLHPSLLPRHRGASPIPATILAGDRESGVSLMQMDAGLDTGPIVAVSRWPLTGLETAPDLETRAAASAATLLEETLPGWLAGRIEPRPQDERTATLTRPLRRADGQIDGRTPAVQLERRVRAFVPWPGTFIGTALGRVAVLRASVHETQDPAADQPTVHAEAPGSLVEDGAGIALATTDGRLRLDEVQPAGGRPMSGEAWHRGRPGLIGSLVTEAPAPEP